MLAKGSLSCFLTGLVNNAYGASDCNVPMKHHKTFSPFSDIFFQGGSISLSSTPLTPPPPLRSAPCHAAGVAARRLPADPGGEAGAEQEPAELLRRGGAAGILSSQHAARHRGQSGQNAPGQESGG